VYRHARMIGIIVTAVGLATLIAFASVAVLNAGEFRKAQLVHQRNPGNAMYDLQFFVAASELVFVIGGAVAGALLVVNGAAWLALGSAVRRLDDLGRARAVVRP
jgi:hypothetical protein